MRSGKQIAFVLAVLLSCVGCDQLTKAIARAYLPRFDVWSFLDDTIRLQLASNYGAFLSLGDSLSQSWRHAVLSIGVGCLLAALLAYLLWAKRLHARNVLPLALVVGGGVSNLIDRLVYDGYVVDFINLGVGSLRTGIFNVADVAITAGVVWLLLGEVFLKSKKPVS